MTEIPSSQLEAENTTSLAPGDIAVVGYHADDPDNFALMVLRPGGLPEGTSFYVTDNGVEEDCAIRSGEGIVQYTAPRLIAAGEVITLLQNATLSSDFEKVEGGLNLAASGDQLLIYQAVDDDSYRTNSSFIYALSTKRDWTTTGSISSTQ